MDTFSALLGLWQKIFSLMLAWTNCWTKIRVAGDLRCHGLMWPHCYERGSAATSTRLRAISHTPRQIPWALCFGLKIPMVVDSMMDKPLTIYLADEHTLNYHSDSTMNSGPDVPSPGRSSYRQDSNIRRTKSSHLKSFFVPSCGCLCRTLWS